MTVLPFLTRFGFPGFSILGSLTLFLGFAACSTSTEVNYSFWEGTLVPLGDNMETGLAAAVTQFGRTEASIELRQGEAEALYGWYLQAGTCEMEGTILGGIASYPLVQADEAGTGNRSALLSTRLQPGSAYAVTVYRALDTGEDMPVACGNLQETTGGGE